MCKLQVGLLGSARGLQKDLERIAGRADTNTPDGLHYVLQGMPLLWRSICCNSVLLPARLGLNCYGELDCCYGNCYSHGNALQDMLVGFAETVLSLLRNPDYCVYGDGGTKNPRGLDGAEDAFNEVVMQERGKFKEETLVNVGGRSRRSSMK